MRNVYIVYRKCNSVLIFICDLSDLTIATNEYFFNVTSRKFVAIIINTSFMF